MTSDLKNSKPEGQIILKWSNKSKFNILEYSEADILSETMSEIMTSDLKKKSSLTGRKYQNILPNQIWSL